MLTPTSNRRVDVTARQLPAIPVVEIAGPGGPGLFELYPERAALLLEAAQSWYGRGFLVTADALSRRWAQRHRIPYLGEIAEIAARVGAPGAWMLNLCYEWGCTTGIAGAPDGEGLIMNRTLDWPLEGLGRQVVVSRLSGPAGPWFNVTWPGFVGVTTALAPGRFAGALNQAPMAMHRAGRIGNWLINRWNIWRNGRMPPTLLLRQAFDHCASFDEAVRLLSDTPICLPAIFTLAGLDGSQGVVIERLETKAFLHPAPVCITNHWLTEGLVGRPRSHHSIDRLDMMRARMAAAAAGFAWLEAPILNQATRLAVTANAATGELTVQGFENGEPATSTLRLVA